MPSCGPPNLLLDDATEAARTIELLGNVISSSNLLASDMMAALSANSSAALDADRESIRRSVNSSSNRTLRRWQKRRTTKLRDAALKLLALGEGENGVFKVRQRELDAIDYGQVILEETRQAQRGTCDQRAATRGWRADRYRCLDLAGASEDFAGDQGHVGTWRLDRHRIGIVRLAICRPQYPATDRQSAAFDAAFVRRRPGDRNLSQPP